MIVFIYFFLEESWFYLSLLVKSSLDHMCLSTQGPRNYIYVECPTLYDVR